MEELSIEEKTKAYDEAIKKLHEIITMDNKPVPPKEIGVYLFPELKESRYEKTKRILHSISYKMSFHLRDIFTEEEFQCFDAWSDIWLEKQEKNNMGISEAAKQELKDNLNEALVKETQESWNEFLDEQQPAWSEEDEKMLDSFLHKLEVCTLLTNKENMWILDKFKSLKDRYTWKPTEEQMHELENACSGKVWNLDYLNSLHQDLKKLRDE